MSEPIKDFINILDFSSEQLERVLRRAAVLKARRRAGIPDNLLAGRTLGMYFEKPSLRTRVSLEVAMTSMGGHAINLETGGHRLGERESIPDQARVMSRFVDAITVRTFEHEVVTTLAAWASVPVINALSDWSHPTQALADILTMREHLGDLHGRTLVFIGDGNNVARSLAGLCAKVGIRFVLAGPKAYHLREDFLDRVRAACPGADLEQTEDVQEAAASAAALYTDVWASMGQEEEAQARRTAFAPYQINEKLLERAPSGTVVLHCLPAHRGDEITDGVMDGPSAVVFDQAENRLHINRSLLAILVAEGGL